MDNLRVLFVDDEKKILLGIERMLKQLLPELEAFFAANASDALILMETMSVDIIITDMCMAGMDGYRLLEIVKQRYPDTVRVMMTGKNDVDIYRNSIEANQYFLFKPVRLSALQVLFELVTNKEFLVKDGSNPARDLQA